MIKKSIIFKNFFVNKVSTKLGEKCCKYGLNGIPMKKDQVNSMYNELKTFLNGWNLNEERTLLYKYLYLEEYYYSTNIISEIIKLDNLTSRNKPNFQLVNSDLLRIDLLSQPLKGLSHVDFELAMKINCMKFSDFNVFELKSNKNYRAQVRMIKNQIENDSIKRELDETYLKNK